MPSLRTETSTPKKLKANTMKQFFRDYRLIWQYGVSYRNSNLTSPGSASGMVAAGFVIAAALLLSSILNKAPSGVATLFGYVALVVGFFFIPTTIFNWFKFLRGAIICNSPANAQLLPRIRIRAIQATLLSWLAVSILTTLYIVVLIKPDSRIAILTGNILVLTALIFTLVGAGLLEIGLLISSPVTNSKWEWEIWLGIAVVLVLALPAPVQAVASILAIPALTALAHALLGSAFMRGGDRHFQFADYAHQLGLPIGQARPFAAKSPVASKPEPKPVTNTDTIQAAPISVNILTKGASPVRVMLLALGLVMHLPGLAMLKALFVPKWRTLKRPDLTTTGIMLFLAYQLFGLWRTALSHDGAANFADIAWLFVALLWFAFWRWLLHDTEQIAKTVAEQKLLCLAPGTTSANFNRQLAIQLLLNGLFIWATGSFFIMLISSLLAVPATTLLYQLSLCSMCLPFITTKLADYSSKTPQSINPSQVLTMVLLTLAAYLIFTPPVAAPAPNHAVIHWLAGFTWQKLWLHLGFALTNVILTLVITAIRLRTLNKVPIAFPAGRYR